MPIRFNCASCDVRIKVPDASEGKKVKCPSCGHAQRVPGTPVAVGAGAQAGKIAVGAGTGAAGAAPKASSSGPVAAPKPADSAAAAASASKPAPKKPVAATSATPPKGAEAPSRSADTVAKSSPAPAAAKPSPPPKHEVIIVPPVDPPSISAAPEISIAPSEPPAAAPDPADAPDIADALSALAAATGSPAAAPAAEETPPAPPLQIEKAKPSGRAVAKAIPLSGPPPADVPIAEARRRSKGAAAKETSKTPAEATQAPAAKAEIEPIAAAPMHDAPMPDAPASDATDAPAARAVPPGPPVDDVPSAESSALHSLRAAMAADEAEAGGSQTHDAANPPAPDSLAGLREALGASDGAGDDAPADESLAAFMHTEKGPGADVYDFSAPPATQGHAATTSSDEPADAPEPASNVELKASDSSDEPQVASADSAAHDAPADSPAAQPAGAADDAQPESLWSAMPLSSSATEPLDPSEAPAGEVRELFDDFVRREELVRQAEDKLADESPDDTEPAADKARPTPRDASEDDEGNDAPPADPSPVIVTRSVPRLVRSGAQTPRPPAAAEKSSPQARPVAAPPVVEVEEASPPPKAIPLSRHRPVPEPEEPVPQPTLALASTEAIAEHFAEPTASRRVRTAPAPSYSLLLVLCWTLRVLACLSLGSIAKLLLMWSDNGAKLTDILIAIPLGLGIAGGIWAIGEVARVARDAARNSHK